MKVVFPSGGYAPEALQPSEETLDLPSSSVTPQGSSALCFDLFSVDFMRGDHFHTQSGQLGVQWIAVIGFVTDNSVRKLHQEASLWSLSDQF